MKKYILLTILFCGFVYSVQATHLRAGQIAVKQMPGGRACKITITVFTNTKNTTVLFGGEQDELNYGDGSPIQLVPETPNTIRIDLDPYGSVATASFTTYHTYASPGSYVISYREPNRNEGVVNMDNSVSTTFYIETMITLTDDGPLYETPTLLMESPVLLGGTGLGYSESLACSDVNDYQLYYDIATPLRDRGTEVTNYRLPGNVSIDHISGLLTWDGEFIGFFREGEYSLAVKIYQLKDNKIIGYMHRDFQLILVDQGMSQLPLLNGGAQANKKVFVPDGVTTQLRVEAGGAGVSKIKLQVKSDLENFANNFVYTITDSIAHDVNYKVAKIAVTNNATITRNTPYQIVVRVKFGDIVTRDLAYTIATKDVDFDYHLPEGPEEPEVPVGIETGDGALGVVLVPNPVKNFLEIKNNNNTTINVQIHDLTGKISIQQAIHTTTQVDVSQLHTGIYVCVLTKGSETAFYKIVKE